MIEKHDYTIDEKFIFEQRKCLIYLKGDLDQSVELSKPAARLFGEILLLNFKKGIATRDELLTNVWEEYGLVGSNNNLNTYISEIRKKLEQVGIDPKTIVTVPKKGFRIDSHLSKFKIDDDAEIISNEIITKDDYDSLHPSLVPSHFVLADDHKSIFDSSPQSTEDTSINSCSLLNDSTSLNTEEIIENKNVISQGYNDSKNKKLIKFSVITFIIAIILISTYIISNNKKYINNQENTYHTVSTRENCIIQTPIEMSEKTTSDTIDFVNKKLEKYNISCDEPKRIILLSDVNSAYSFDKNIALSICKEKNNRFECVSINDQKI